MRQMTARRPVVQARKSAVTAFASPKRAIAATTMNQTTIAKRVIIAAAEAAVSKESSVVNNLTVPSYVAILRPTKSVAN